MGEGGPLAWIATACAVANVLALIWGLLPRAAGG